MALLEVKNLGISFGGLRAVDAFDVAVEPGQLYGLIGPNGAGKTTIFNLLTGVYQPTEGKILLDGKDITGKKTIDINRAGGGDSEASTLPQGGKRDGRKSDGIIKGLRS